VTLLKYSILISYQTVNTFITMEWSFDFSQFLRGKVGRYIISHNTFITNALIIKILVNTFLMIFAETILTLINLFITILSLITKKTRT